MSHTVLAAEVGCGHVLQRDLPEEGGSLAARVPSDDSPAAEPRPKPGDTAVTGERIGQEVPARHRHKGSVRTLVFTCSDGFSGSVWNDHQGLDTHGPTCTVL